MAQTGVRRRAIISLIWPTPASAYDRCLITRGAYRIVRNLGAKIGIHHPHMKRHSAITQAVEKSVGMGLSLDKVRDFSRHKNIGTLMVYRTT
jgi:integrase